MKHDNISVLYVEDEPKIRESYARIIGEMFPRTFIASCGNEAFQIYEEEKPDIVIADIVIPGFDGLEFVSKIRRKDLRTRIILLTAFNDNNRLLKAASLNISNFLVKPVRKKEFLESLENALGELQLLDDTASRSNSLSKHHTNLKFYCDRFDNLRLTPNEYILLSILAEFKEQYCPMNDLIDIFESEYNKKMTENAVKATIRRLRKKYPGIQIENLYGVGYRLKL